ncbi:hypothetical protein Tco_0157178 [Tanacetum coccineum]
MLVPCAVILRDSALTGCDNGIRYQEKDKNKSKYRQNQAREWKEHGKPKPKAYTSLMGQPIIGFMAVWIEGTGLEDRGASQALDPSAHGYK